MIGWDCADTYIWLMKLAQVASIGLIVGISCALLTGGFPSELNFNVLHKGKLVKVGSNFRKYYEKMF